MDVMLLGLSFSILLLRYLTSTWSIEFSSAWGTQIRDLIGYLKFIQAEITNKFALIHLIWFIYLFEDEIYLLMLNLYHG